MDMKQEQIRAAQEKFAALIQSEYGAKISIKTKKTNHREN